MKSIQALLNLNPKNARLADEFIEGGRREGENEPLLSAFPCGLISLAPICAKLVVK